MKILIMMPLDERYSFASVGLFNKIDEDIRDKVMIMPYYVDTLHQWYKINWELAVKTALSQDEILYQQNDIIIGNLNKYSKFDIIFNITDGEHEEPYKDNYVELIEKKENKNYELHTADESKFCLVNFEAAGKLISKLYKDGKVSEEKLKELKEEYERKLESGGLR